MNMRARGGRGGGPNSSCPDASNEGMVQSRYFMVSRAEFCSLWLSCTGCVEELVCTAAIFCSESILALCCNFLSVGLWRGCAIII